MRIKVHDYEVNPRNISVVALVANACCFAHLPVAPPAAFGEISTVSRLIEKGGAEAARTLGSSTARGLPFTRFLGTGDEEDEVDIRVGDNVLDRVEVIVAWSIGNEQGLVVVDLHKARRGAAGRNVRFAGGVRCRGIRRASA